MRNKVLIIVALVIIAIVIASVLSYWEGLPYVTYTTGEEITGFPFQSTSMTVNGYSTSPDITFPESATDVYVNVTVQRLDTNQDRNPSPQALNANLFLNFQTSKGNGWVSARNSADSFGIVTPDNKLNSLGVNQSVDGSIQFVLGNDNYTSYQLVCRTESQQKPLFIVDLQNP